VTDVAACANFLVDRAALLRSHSRRPARGSGPRPGGL